MAGPRQWHRNECDADCIFPAPRTPLPARRKSFVAAHSFADRLDQTVNLRRRQFAGRLLEHLAKMSFSFAIVGKADIAVAGLARRQDLSVRIDNGEPGNAAPLR
jgi:hypothetical protein